MIKKKILPMLLAAAFIFCMISTEAFAAGFAVYDAGTPEELSAALHNASGRGTIRLTADIDYNTGIVVTGKSITFDLNGHTLNVASSKGHGLEVGSGGVVDMKGSGVFNVTSSADYDNVKKVNYSGVYAKNGGKAKVTNATGTGIQGIGAHANSLDSCIEVTGDVKGSGIGAYADDGGHIIVGGNAEGVTAVSAYATISLVEVAGNVTATGKDCPAQGVSATGGGTVRVTGNAASNDCGVLCCAGTVWVGGNVTGGQTGVYFQAIGNNNVTIDGTLTAPNYINMFDMNQLIDGEPGTGNDTGYLVYKDETDIVRVKIKSPATLPAEPAVYNAGTTKELSAALNAAVSGGTIRLTADIDYNTGIVVTGKTITFDLNGHTLNVVSSTGHGLKVGSGGAQDIKGSGAFNVTSSKASGNVFHHGVYAEYGGKAKVTSATGTGPHGVGAYAYGEGSCIEVTGDVKGTDIGAYADSGGYCFVGGNLWGDTAAFALGNLSLVEVAGDVTASGNDGQAHGASVQEGGTVKVTGNVSGDDVGLLCVGGTVWVGGNVTGVQASVIVRPGTDVTIDGKLTPADISGDIPLTGVPGTGDDADYLIYTNGDITVRVKIKSPAVTLRGIGISACPISDTQVEMEKQAIDIAQRGGCTYVTCESWLHNTGESADIIAGTYYSMARLNWFHTLVDGKRVDVSLEKGLKPEGSNIGDRNYPERYTWRMHFAADERIKVVNTYWFINPTEGEDADTAGYIIRGSAAWKGHIGSITVRMHPEDFEMENTTFGGMQPTYIEEDGTVIWEAENIEPDKDIIVDRKTPDGPSAVNPFAGNDDEFLPYRTMTLRMLRNFYAGQYNGVTWWGNRMFSRFGGTQSSQLYYCMGVSYYKLGLSEKALDMFGRIADNADLYAAMSAYYKSLICKDSGDDAGYQSYVDSIKQYLSGIPADEMTMGAFWLKSRLADLSKPQS